VIKLLTKKQFIERLEKSEYKPVTKSCVTTLWYIFDQKQNQVNLDSFYTIKFQNKTVFQKWARSYFENQPESFPNPDEKLKTSSGWIYRYGKDWTYSKRKRLLELK
jgi:hypothetical protein